MHIETQYNKSFIKYEKANEVMFKGQNLKQNAQKLKLDNETALKMKKQTEMTQSYNKHLQQNLKTEKDQEKQQEKQLQKYSSCYKETEKKRGFKEMEKNPHFGKVLEPKVNQFSINLENIAKA